MAEVAELSEYEKQRNENIARNQRVLEALGLVRSDAELHHECRSRAKEPKAKRQKEDPNSAEAVRAAVRRSHRLAGIAADEDHSSPQPSTSQTDTVPQKHEDAKAEYDLWTQRWCRKQAGVTIVGTASYAHSAWLSLEPSTSGLACSAACLPCPPPLLTQRSHDRLALLQRSCVY